MKLISAVILIFFILLYFQNIYAQNGVVKTYYNDGAIETEVSYINDILDGSSIYYYPNGNVREEISFSLGKVNGPHRFYYENGLLKEESNLSDGMLDGLTKIYYSNGALKQALNYEYGKLLKKINVPYDSTYTAPVEMYLAGNRQYKLSKEAEIVSDAEICPVPLNGIKDIQNNLVYPKEAEQNKTEGVVTVSVKVDSSGKAGGAQIIKGLSKECDAAAINAVEKTKFLPGKTSNKAVNSKIVLNVEFKLADKPVMQDYVQKVKQEVEQILATPERISDSHLKPAENGKPVQAAETKKIATNEEPRKISAQKEIPLKEEPKKEIILASVNPVQTGDDIPFPVGGLERILARTVLPKKAIEQKIEGEVIFKVEVDKYGVVRDTKLVKGLGYGVDEAIEVAIMDSPFKPALINGEKVRAEVTLNIPFTYKK